MNNTDPDIAPTPNATRNTMNRSYNDLLNIGTNSIPNGADTADAVTINKPITHAVTIRLIPY